MVFLNHLDSLDLGFRFLVINMINYLCISLSLSRSLSLCLSVCPSVWLSSPSVRPPVEGIPRAPKGDINHVMYHGMYDGLMLNNKLNVNDFWLFLGSLSYMVSPGSAPGGLSEAFPPSSVQIQVNITSCSVWTLKGLKCRNWFYGFPDWVEQFGPRIRIPRQKHDHLSLSLSLSLSLCPSDRLSGCLVRPSVRPPAKGIYRVLSSRRENLENGYIELVLPET